MNGKPRVTDKVLRGILAACSVVLAGDIASAFGHEDSETRKSWDDACRAQAWARQMIIARKARENRRHQQ